MIDYLEIQNYKMFEKLRLNGLGRVNLIVGKNNVGKSSLLEIGYIASSPVPAYALLRVLEMRRVALAGYAREFLGKFWGDRYDTQVRPFDFGIKIKPEYGLPLQLKGNRGKSGLPDDEEFEKIILRERTTINPQRLLGAALLGSCGSDAWEVENFWEVLKLRGSEGSIVDALRLANPEILRVALLKDGNVTPQPYVVTNGGESEIALSRMGEGMTRLFGLAFNLGVAAGGTAFIDEIENGLHYELHEQVCDFIFEVAAKLNVQVFLTTHSLDFTRAFARSAHKSSELGRLYRLTRQLGYLEAVDYTERELLIAAEQEIEVR